MAESSDDLEYYIKFPTGTDCCFNVKAGDDEKLPVVLLFGWAGCQDKYLAKYSAVYESFGLVTIRYTAPLNNLIWKRTQVSEISQKLVDLLIEMKFDKNPIIIHLFSNGGAFLYQNLLMCMETYNELPFQIQGVIFDSAPGRRRVRTLFKAISEIFGGKKYYNLMISVLLTIIVCIAWLFEFIKKLMPDTSTKPTNPFDFLTRNKLTNQWPMHFIYSKADELVPYTDVEEFITRKQTEGDKKITQLRFDDSAHVKHLVQHKETYIKSVKEFVESCFVQH